MYIRKKNDGGQTGAVLVLKMEKCLSSTYIFYLTEWENHYTLQVLPHSSKKANYRTMYFDWGRTVFLMRFDNSPIRSFEGLKRATYWLRQKKKERNVWGFVFHFFLYTHTHIYTETWLILFHRHYSAHFYCLFGIQGHHFPTHSI